MNLYWKYLGVLLYIFAWKAQELTAVEQNGMYYVISAIVVYAHVRKHILL